MIENQTDDGSVFRSVILSHVFAKELLISSESGAWLSMLLAALSAAMRAQAALADRKVNNSGAAFGTLGSSA